MKSELKENQPWAAKISLSLPNKKVKVNSQIKLTILQMLIVLRLNIYMANNLRIDISYLLAQATEYEITLLIVSQIEMRSEADIIFLAIFLK